MDERKTDHDVSIECRPKKLVLGIVCPMARDKVGFILL
jgi:hypothetical protein